jgi:hypothetical protein
MLCFNINIVNDTHTAKLKISGNTEVIETWILDFRLAVPYGPHVIKNKYICLLKTENSSNTLMIQQRCLLSIMHNTCDIS